LIVSRKLKFEVCIGHKAAIVNCDFSESSAANITSSSNGRIDWVLEPGYARTVHPINTPLC